jgi:glycosyltransferase involved in cell wall biosynthesis
MKEIKNILFVAPYVSIDSNPKLIRNRTGFGYMVYDIAKYIAIRYPVSIYMPSTFTESSSVEDVTIVGRSIPKFLLCLKLNLLIDGIRFVLKYKPSFSTAIRCLYYYASLGQLSSILKYYDIVHIHGCGPLTHGTIRLCKKKKIPFIVTLHGLNSNTNASILQKQCESDFLRQSQKLDIYTSVVSTGVLKRIYSYLNIAESYNFIVITNGCVINNMRKQTNIREQYGIAPTDFVFACVGNISERKNQFQILQAYLMLPESIKKYVKILFVGKIDDVRVLDLIAANDLQDHLILCGSVCKEDVDSFYVASNATILASVSEGFGLSIIEGFSYGLPALVFSDMDAIPDLYHKDAMIAVNIRSDKALSQGMIDMCDTVWNRSWIVQYAHNFSLDKVAENYLLFYKKALDYEK